MAQVIESIGGEYRNRTGVHGFAIRLHLCLIINYNGLISIFDGVNKIVYSVAYRLYAQESPAWGTFDGLKAAKFITTTPSRFFSSKLSNWKAESSFMLHRIVRPSPQFFQQANQSRPLVCQDGRRHQ